jgi:hypothetical protein
MNSNWAAALAAHGITRLCHFTPSRNLGHILATGEGLLSSRQLAASERAIFNPTDLERLDGYPDHICCSIEYPNAWYLDRARAKEVLFRDWVVLFLVPELLAGPGTLFCPRNAAAGFGLYIRAGIEAFESLYAETVCGSGGRQYTRGGAHLPAVPTDQQAEVLVPDRIAIADILGVAVSSDTQVRQEVVRLELLGVDPRSVNFAVAPALFRKYDLDRHIKAGVKPPEIPWSTET